MIDQHEPMNPKLRILCNNLEYNKMSIKKIKPITPGQRFKITNSFVELSKYNPLKSLIKGKKYNSGRNNSGKITVKHVGGGHKKKYRIIDFKRNKIGIDGIIKSIEYDPNRSTFISLVNYRDGEKRYILCQDGIKIGQSIICNKSITIQNGNTTFLSEIPLGTIISCIELNPGQGAKLARSAGAYAKLSSKEGNYVTVKLPSGESRMILSSCMATIGSMSNLDHKLLMSGKAGRSRWLGVRPRTRAIAMNPVDHPMGGGEGKASGGHPRNRYGIPAKGYKTRSKNKISNKYILKNRK
jgi:large subunit ribosomal protein L2